MLTTGLSYLFQSATSTIASSISNLEDNSNMFFIARVIDISLNSNSEIFNNSGGWAGIGSIKFQQLDISVTPSSKNEESTTFAKPITGQLKNYPLVNELVLIFRGPSTKQTQITNTKNFYYINTVAIWGNQHINAYPDSYFTNTDLAPSMGKSNDEILAGSTNKNTTQTTTIPLNGNSGGTFEEKGNIHPILPFAGDNIFEGRFGNSIRLGNTSKTGGLQNNWSSTGDNGSPITILKNGQPSSGSSKGFEPIVEDINTDPTSIYLTSTQNIPIEVASSKQDSGEGSTVPFSNLAKQTPQSPKSYNAPQVILNSGRLLFNSTTDCIMMSSQKSILAEAREDIGLKSIGGNLTLQSDKGIVSLGGISSEQPIVRGTEFANSYATLLDALELLIEALSKESMIPAAASSATLILNMIKEINVEDSTKFPFLSNKVKTI
jgi:hypothetical protein|tara:strand:- start:70 stop:1374 length:1305 start_codon:yes stop_codon:yes gene_type:complete